MSPERRPARRGRPKARASNPAGGKVTIHTIARACGTSSATVSLVINDKWRGKVSEQKHEEVLRAIAAHGYAPDDRARFLGKENGRRPGKENYVVANFRSELFAYSFPARVLIELQQALSARGYRLLLSSGQGEASFRELGSFLSSPMAMKAAGWVFMSYFPPEVLDFAAGQGIPSLLVGNAITRHERLCAISSDNRGGGALAARHLMAAGHRRIGILAPKPAMGNVQGYVERIEGAAAALREAGLEPTLVETPDDAGRGPAGHASVLNALGRHRLTALFAVNDLHALQLLPGLADAGIRVPGDLSLVGFDNDYASGLAQPGLTSIDGAAGLGAETAARMCSAIGGEILATAVQVPVRLVERQSVAAPGS